MDKKIMMIGIVMLVLASFANGAIPDDLETNAIVYYELEENGATPYVDSTGTLSLTLGTVPTRTTGKISFGQDFEAGSSEYLTTTTNAILEATNPFFCTWIKPETAQGTIASTFVSSSGYYGWFLTIDAGGVLRWDAYDGDTGDFYRWESTTTLSTGTFYHICVHYDSSVAAANRMAMYINGVSDGSQTQTGNNNLAWTTGNHLLTIMRLNTNYGDGVLDEIYYGDYSGFDSTHASYLYASGSPGQAQQYPFTGLFEIYLNDAVGDSLLNFTANISNSTGSIEITTTNGSILYPTSQIINISLFDVNNTGWVYKNITSLNVNTSTVSTTLSTDVYDLIKPTITLNPFNGFNTTNLSNIFQFGDILPLNLSFADNRDLYGFYVNITKSGVSYFNFTNYTLSGTSADYYNEINISSWPSATYDVLIEVYDSKTRNRTDPSIEIHNTTQENYKWFRGNYTKDEPLLFEFETDDLILYLTDDSTIASITADLYFDGSLVVNTSSTDIGANWKLSNEVGNKAAGTYPYVWVVEVNQTDGSTSSGNISGSIEVFAFGIDNCSSYNYTTLRMTIYDEESPDNNLTATVEIDAEIWISTPDNSRQFFELLTGSSYYELCLLNPNAVFYTDMYIKYTTEDGFTHRYYIVNGTLTNVTQNISMYNFNKTTGISDLKITVRDYDTYQYFPNVIAKFQRRYPSEGVWRTVQMDESGDFGLVFFNIKEENTDYRILFYDRSNNLLQTTEKMKFICDAGVCELTFTVSQYAQVIIAQPVEVTTSFDNATKILTISWVDPDAGTKTVKTEVIKPTITGDVIICTQTQSGAAGSVVCNVSAYSGDILIKVTTNSLDPFREWFNIARQRLATLVDDDEGGFWSFAIILTVAMMGVIFGPVGSILTAIIGLIFIYFIGLFNPITITFIIIAGAIGTAISIKMRK